MSRIAKSPMDSRPGDTLLQIVQLIGKYDRLYWYALSTYYDTPLDPAEVEKTYDESSPEAEAIAWYPDEVELLRNPEMRDEAHAYNCGVLAAAMLLFAHLDPKRTSVEWDAEIVKAEEQFPILAS